MINLPIWLIIPLLACWGSFLNVIAYRLVHDIDFTKSRSICPKCCYQIAWYDLIPIFSWLNLVGKCRNCKQSISYLYPTIEFFTIIVGLAAVYLSGENCFFLTNFILLSSLIIIIRTDLETMLISRFTTLFLIPVPIILSLIKIGKTSLLPISLPQVLLGALFGYFILFFINKLFWYLTSKTGLGQGDLDLLSTIGAFTGCYGVWVSLMIGSILGSILGLILIYFKQTNMQTKIPFGPFLAIGAICYVLFQNTLLNLLFY